MRRIIASAAFWFYLFSILPTCRAGDDGHELEDITADEILDETSACERLSVGSFDSYIAAQRESERATLVMFHVKWCQVCQGLFPQFEAAAEALTKKVSDVPLNFTHVDCEEDKAICSFFELTGYPSIKLFGADPSSEPRTYKGFFDESGFVEYAERMTQPPVLRLAGGRADFDKLVLGDRFAVFAAEVPEGEEVPQSLWDAAAARMDEHKFCAVGSLRDVTPELAEVPQGAKMAVVARGALQWPGIGRGNPPKAPPVAAFYTGHLDDSDEVTGWLKLNRFPGIWNISADNFFEFSHADRPAVIVAVDPAKLGPEDEVAIRNASVALADNFIFGVIDGTNFSDFLLDFGIIEEELPRVMVTESNFKFWVEDAEALTAASLEADLRSLLAGAPLRRHERNVWTKLLLYKRTAWRYERQLREYAVSGPKAAAVVGSGIVAVLFLLLVTGGSMVLLCKALFVDDRPYYTRRSVVNGFSGYWRTENGKGKLEHITDGRMRGVESYTELDGSRCCATFDGKRFTGTLAEDFRRLAWSDGDVWHREGPLERKRAGADLKRD